MKQVSSSSLTTPFALFARDFVCSWTPRAVLFLTIALVGSLRTLAQSAPADFAVEDVLLGLQQPISLRFLPDGRMLVILKQGEMLIADVAVSPGQAASYLSLSDPAHTDGINIEGERGLLDIAIDPSFPSEPYVYVYYTPATGNARIARFTHTENKGGLTSQGDLLSELVLWQDTEGYDSCCHFGGGLDFGPDGNLWLTAGDHFQGSYAASLENAGGGVIRIEKNGNIPVDNPYVDGNGPQVDSKFAYGLRNPFRARWDLPTGRLLIAEVGGNEQMKAWEDLHVLQYDLPTGRFIDGDFGTAKDDGVFDGIYFGWPTVEGLPPHTDFPAADIQPIAEPIFGYPHNGEYSAITGGVIYRGNQFPAEYEGAYFYGDSMRGFIRYLEFNPDGSVAPNPNPAPISPTNPDATSYPFDLATLGQVVCLEVGPEGSLYYVSFNDAGHFGTPGPGSVRRYVYEPATSLPIITEFTAAPDSGLPPLDVTFTVEATDPEAQPLSLTLDFGDGQAPTTQPLPDGSPVTVAHSYETDGAYLAVLQVTDGLQVASAVRETRVGNPPVITQLVSTNNNPNGLDDVFRFGDVMTFAAEAIDVEDGPLSGENFSWSISFIRPGASHPAIGPLGGSTSILFPIPAQGQGFSGPVFYRCFLTVRDSSGLSTAASIDIFPDKVNIAFSSVPDGSPIQIDGNTTRLAPFTLDTLINFDHVITVPVTRCIGGVQYDFAGWSNGPATPQQTYNVPPIDSALTAMFTAVGPCDGPPADGLVMHLDATTGLVLSGGTVVSWQDETLQGNELFSAGGPVRLPAEFNGQDAVRFDGFDDALGRTGFLGLPTGSADRSLFLVGRYNAPNPNGSSWAGFVYGTTASNSAFGLALTPAGILGVQGWGAADISSNPPANGIGGLLSQSALYEGGLLTQYKTGAAIGTASHLFATGTTAIRLGEELNGGKNLDMDVAEVLAYDRSVTEAERTGIESYFENRYQITMGGGNPPDVRILAPNNGSSLLTSEMPITLSAVASDFEDGALGPSIVWSSKLDGVLGTGANLSATLSEGQHLIVARVEDSSLLQNTDEVDILVTSSFKGLITSGLVLRLEADQNVTIQSGSTVAGWLDGSALGNDLLALGNPQWVEGLTPAGLPAIRLDGDGDSLERIHATHPLVGFPTASADRTVFLLVRYLGSSAWAGVAYGTAATNQAFGLIVKHPTGELVLQGYSSGDLVSSTLGIGTGWLVHSGTLANGIGRMFRDGQQIAQWSHIYDTTLDRLVIGAEITNFGYVTADVAAVLVYERALGDSERASVESYLYDKYLAPNTAPILSILVPKDGSLHNAGASIQFSGVASDKQDGDLTPAIEWNSSVDGFLGTGGSISTSALSPGAHTITASVTDSGSLGAVDAITLAVNAAPGVDITSPADGSVHAAGSSVTFAGTATDLEDGNLGAQLAWSSSLDGSIGSGVGFASASLSAGTHTITAAVTDVGGLGGTDTITLVINASPEVDITSPADGSVHAAGSSVTFAATATDLEDGDLGAQLTWNSSLDGALGSGAGFSSASLSVGTHTITAAVTDSGGLAGTDVITLAVGNPPVVDITSPADGSVHAAGSSVTFAGTATDLEDGDLGAQLAWSSSLDGSIGSGVGFASAILSAGTHTITAAVTDVGGLGGTDTITLVINAPPEVDIISPVAGSVHAAGSSVTFAATATDLEDGDLGAQLTWNSSLDGALGSGAGFSSASLSVGTHTITAAVTDSGGLAGTAVITLAVGNPPVVDITSPADGSVHAAGSSVTFAGTATDLEDGDLGAQLAWSSSLDGSIGSGVGFASASLSAGTHTITAAVTDVGGLGGTDTITLVINAPPEVDIISPVAGSVHVAGSSAVFAGTATDLEDGDLGAQLAWNSSLDGALGNGAGFSSTSLSVGMHTITAAVTDSGGLGAMDAITLMVRPAPQVSVHLTRLAYLAGSTVILAATATDADNGDLSAQVSWRSDRDGALGVGAKIAVSKLSVGRHRITATVTDPEGLVSAETFSITILNRSAQSR